MTKLRSVNSVINTRYPRLSTTIEVNSDNLIAVGNNDCNQVPSKIFEYMSFGKPIVYFYSDDDVNVKILKKYPIALCLRRIKFD